MHPLGEIIRRHAIWGRFDLSVRWRRRRCQLREERVEQLCVEGELLDRLVGALFGAEIGLDREIRILVLQIDRQLELLSHVIRIDLERELRLAERALEVTETGEGEAQVIMRLRVRWPGLNRASECVLRVLVLL